MGQPAAKKGDLVIATDTHIVMVPSPGGPVPTPMAMPFNGVLDGALSSTVKIDGKPAAVDGSTSSNTPPHIPAGGPFQRPPSGKGTIKVTGGSVYMDHKLAAKNGDPADTCNDPQDLPVGTVNATGTTIIG